VIGRTILPRTTRLEQEKASPEREAAFAMEKFLAKNADADAAASALR
jgi:hypothetical protein